VSERAPRHRRETPQNPLVPPSPASRMSMVAHRWLPRSLRSALVERRAETCPASPRSPTAHREYRHPTLGVTVPAAVSGHRPRPHPRAQRFTCTLSRSRTPTQPPSFPSTPTTAPPPPQTVSNLPHTVTALETAEHPRSVQPNSAHTAEHPHPHHRPSRKTFQKPSPRAAHQPTCLKNGLGLNRSAHHCW
jgi:hypothetical protein